MGIAEEGLDAEVGFEAVVLGELGAVVESDGLAQLGWQGLEPGDELASGGFGSKRELTCLFHQGFGHPRGKHLLATLDRPLAAADIPLTHTQGPFDGGREPNAQCMCQVSRAKEVPPTLLPLAGYRVVRASGTDWSSR